MKFSSVTDGAVSCVISQVDPKHRPGRVLRELSIHTVVGGCSLSEGDRRRLEIARAAVAPSVPEAQKGAVPNSSLALCKLSPVWAFAEEPVAVEEHKCRQLRGSDLIKMHMGKQNNTLMPSPANFSGKLLLSAAGVKRASNLTCGFH